MPVVAGDVEVLGRSCGKDRSTAREEVGVTSCADQSRCRRGYSSGNDANHDMTVSNSRPNQ